MFAENMCDGFEIDPIEVQVHPKDDNKYRILDGAHRLQAYKKIGATEISVNIITLDGLDPLLYKGGRWCRKCLTIKVRYEILEKCRD